ncbi:MAG: AmmeMemoRadiSam system protein B [Chitinispirillaceae bacterium]|jgi:hypothetical protein|nr:AmmeMemoRadiSam system protein B [Chitinispirillaceae bacterium]
MTTLFTGATPGDAIRNPAVAGQFYPADPRELRHDVEQYIAGGAPLPVAPQIIISPHAGYVFSGPVAGKGFAAVDRSIKTVILMGPPHHVPVQGVSVSSASFFETPLGKVPVDRDRVRKLLANTLVQSSDRAHGPEHSLEVQIPFLQVRLSSFSIVPLLVGETDPEKAAACILPLVDEHTLLVASSDMSHYMPQKQARAEDDRSIADILSGRIHGHIDACGEMPIRVAMICAKKMGLSPKLIDKRTSFETAPQYGSGDRVVGYASIVYIPAEIAPDVKKKLLAIARGALEAAVRRETYVPPADVPEYAREKRGCFVTLKIRGELRGCIGYIDPIKPLYQAVIENACSAALSDPRFNPVTPSELSSIKLEVSVLTTPEILEYSDPVDLLNKLVPGVDGIILKQGSRQSTFLPQVWEQLPDKVDFLEHLSQKGGMPMDGWKTAQVKRYRAEHFSEQ